MSSYYYFAASLPMLSFGAKPTVTIEEFFSKAQQCLNEKDFNALHELENSLPNIELLTKSAKDYIKWNFAIKNQFVKIRSAKFKIDEKKYSIDVDSNPFAENVANEVLKISSPLELEHRLNSLRWNYLEDLKTLHFYDLDILSIYFLQLEIAHREADFDVTEGKQVYSQLYKDITGDSYEY